MLKTFLQFWLNVESAAVAEVTFRTTPAPRTVRNLRFTESVCQYSFHFIHGFGTNESMFFLLDY